MSLALIKGFDLRDYQIEAVEALRRKLASGIKKVVLIAPTGSGKTICAAYIVQSAVGKSKRVAFVANRRELIAQTVDKLSSFGIDAGVVMAGEPGDIMKPCQVCSIQTLARRMDRLPPADVLIVDECHHSSSNSWKKLIDAYHGLGAVVVGLTATPFRTDRLGLKDLFEDFVLAATPGELMASGSLVRYDARAWDAPELHEVGMVAGDYNQSELELACNTSVLVGSAVRDYVEHAKGRPALCFAVSVKHSQSLVEEFGANNVIAAHIDAQTPTKERDLLLEKFRRGAIDVISSVGILTEGFDAPVAEVAILCRPTKSLSLHLQMLGRVLRPAPGKLRALYHDHAGNLLRHGLPDDSREWNIENTPQSVILRHTCPACKAIYSALSPDGRCPACKVLIANPQDICGLCGLDKPCECEARPRKGKIKVAGRMIDLAEIRSIRAGKGIQRELTDDQIVRIELATRADKVGEYLRLRAVAESKGFKPGFVSHQYRAVFGCWPKFSDEELDGQSPAARPFLPLSKSNFKAPGGWPE